MTDSRTVDNLRGGFRRGGGALLLLPALWVGAVLVVPSGSVQLVSNAGLVAVSLLAGVAMWARSTRCAGRIRRFWRLLGTSCLAWSAGQVLWTVLEALGRDVPIASLADAGYLMQPPLCAAALMSLPLSAPTLAGRVRSVLDGLVVAASLLLCSWLTVLGPVLEAGALDPARQVVSLAYPIGDVIVVTLLASTWLQARRLPDVAVPVQLHLVGFGLLAFAVSDSAFTYLATMGRYSSGGLVDIGGFTGFMVLLAAAVTRPGSAGVTPSEAHLQRPIRNLLPYAAVSVALLTSAVELWRTGHLHPVVSWIRTVVLFLLVARQVLTMLESDHLARHLEARVDERTAALRAREQRFAALVQHSSDVVTVLDQDGVVTYQSASSERVLGHEPSSLVGRPLSELMDESSAADLSSALAAAEEGVRQTLHSVWRHADGRQRQVEVTITSLLDHPHVTGLVLNTRDITERVLLEKQLTVQAFTDSLTGLPNRALFKDRLQRALQTTSREDTAIAVLFLDLDGFKAVNDTLGHSAGDDLLVQVAERLCSVVRTGDTMARFGGDEFAVLVTGAAEHRYETRLAARIKDALGAPFQLRSQPREVHVRASIGIAQAGPHGSDAEQLLRNADLAMYQAKAARNGGFATYDPQMHAALVNRVRLEDDLRNALEHRQFVLHYQPMHDLNSGRITGTEALIRWQHPERGLVHPDEFIPLAEASGLILDIGGWVLQEACRQAVAWVGTIPDCEALTVGVNVSSRQLASTDFASRVETALRDSGLAPQALTLEITESILVSDAEGALRTLEGLKELGVRLAIDDFGTGYSSLSYLHRFPVDVLKVDRSFIRRIASGADSALVGTILRLGHSMNLETVAEGIERPQEMQLLRRQGCATGQGTHFSPPLPAEEMTAQLLGQPSAAPVGAAAL